MPRDKLLTFREAAEILRVDARNMQRYHDEGRIRIVNPPARSHASAPHSKPRGKQKRHPWEVARVMPVMHPA